MSAFGRKPTLAVWPLGGGVTPFLAVTKEHRGACPLLVTNGCIWFDVPLSGQRCAAASILSIRDRIQDAIRAEGFADLQEAHLAVFSYPRPEAVRPSEFARGIGMSRQAANHLIRQMETLGYLERRCPASGERRLVYLTDRGWKVCEAIFACLQDLQAEWANEIGHERFADFMAVLRTLAGWTAASAAGALGPRGKADWFPCSDEQQGMDISAHEMGEIRGCEAW